MQCKYCQKPTVRPENNVCSFCSTTGKEYRVDAVNGIDFNNSIILKNMKSIYRSKTIWLAVIQTTIGILIAVNMEYPELGGVMIGKSILDIILRVITTMPVDLPERGKFEK